MDSREMKKVLMQKGKSSFSQKFITTVCSSLCKELGIVNELAIFK